MPKIELSYDRLPTIDGGRELLALSDDVPSCRLFLASLLDHAASSRVERVCFRPENGDQCLTVRIGQDVYEMAPLPAEFRIKYLKLIHQMVLGRFGYFVLVCFRGKSFHRNNCGPLTVEVAGRRSKWSIRCMHDAVCFTRIQ